MALTNLWAAMRTWNLDEAETDSRIVLSINDDGQDDLLHHTFGNTDQDDQDKGESNLYPLSSDLAANIDPGNLNPSSIRVGIRGDDLWAPEDFFVFGEENGNPIPLALSRNITKRLSSDPTESTDPSEPAFDARLSIPITPVTLGDSSTDIRRLLVLMLTGEEGTHSRVQLRIITTNPPSQVVVFDMPPPSLPADSAQGSQDHQEADQASFYYVEEETGNPVIEFRKSDLDDTSITLSLQEAGDSWLPASFFIFGIAERVATSPVTILPLVHIPVWDQTGHGTLEGPITVPLPLSP